MFLANDALGIRYGGLGLGPEKLFNGLIEKDGGLYRGRSGATTSETLERRNKTEKLVRA